jgi:hypothetical protein
MQGTVILIPGYGLGRADESLQLKLMGKYLELLLQGSYIPSAICFYTDGVKLVCEGSPVLEPLHRLEVLQVRLISCSTCLNDFGLRENVKVGIVGGMGDIIEAQARAEKVITI